MSRWGATYHGSVTQTPSPVRADGTGDGTAPLPAARGRVLLAAPRGYCAGVDRAVVAVEKALELYGAPVYVRKQIVHNKHVVATLEQRGAVFVDETDEVPEGPTSCSRRTASRRPSTSRRRSVELRRSTRPARW